MLMCNAAYVGGRAVASDVGPGAERRPVAGRGWLRLADAARAWLRWGLAAAAWMSGSAAHGAAALELRRGDRVCIVGNALADRLQHAGWLEALIHTRFPEHELVFRNLGFAGDELTVRLRSEGFGSPDDWLRRTQADAILACFGFNESFRGEAGLEEFRRDLDRYVRDTLRQDYGGRGPPRLVLLSPLAQERHADPNFPDPTGHNRVLASYTRVMAEVAHARGVGWVDLFALSQRAYERTSESLTVNGVHLRDAGYRALAPAMFAALLGEPAPPMTGGAFARLRAAVDAKNAEWFRRYRTVDGFNVYGGRSHLEYNGVKNRDTMQREMEMRDVLTANHDRRVWAAARGQDLVVPDDNLPAPIPVTSNKPGPNPDGSHRFLSGEAAIARLRVPPGCRVNLFASEAEFPELINPVQMAFDARGRLWVAVWPNYPERTPQSTAGDRLLVFEDTDGDGRAERCTTFLDDLNCPTGFQFHRDGVAIVQAPDVWFARDTDGDGRADWRERVLSGLDSADSHHTANALALDPGGAIYLSDGVFHRTQVETAAGVVRNQDAAIYRFEPRTGKFETYIAYGFANPHGRVFDRWGNDLVTDATGNHTYFGPAFSGRLDYPEKHAGLREFWNRPSRPCPGTGLLSSRHFPPEFQGNFLNCNVIGFQGIFRVKVREEGSGLWGDTLEPALVQSDDPNFRPTAVGVGPDGAVYFLDWHNPIIGHMQHHLRDPSRDHRHGRIYRITYPARPLLESKPIAGAPIATLLERLREPEDDVRLRAKLELGTRDTAQVIAAVDAWARRLDPARLEDQHALAEALWVHQWHNVVAEPLLHQLLASPEPRARAAAVRVLCYWRDRVSEPLARVRRAANDPSPRVRLEAVRAASFFAGSEALEVAHDILKYDTDYYLDYTLAETVRQLKKSWPGPFFPRDPAVLARLVTRFTNAELLQAPAVAAVLVERVQRPGLDINARNEALVQLARLRGTDRVHEALAALRRLDQPDAPWAPLADLGLALTVFPAEVRPVRPALAALAAQAQHPAVRRAAFAGIVAGDGRPEIAWAETASDPAARVVLVDSILHHADPDFRVAFLPLLTAVLAESATPPEVRRAALRALPLMGPDHAAASCALLAGQMRAGHELATAASAWLQLPQDAWARAEAGPVTEAILGWARQVPAAQRTESAYLQTVQLGLELAGGLPPADQGRVRQTLLDLGVRVFVLQTVREAMRFSTTRWLVEAGKPFEVRLENVDMMPHNFVLVTPGAREAIGQQAEKMAPTPDGEGRAYVPKDPRVLAASRLLEPGQSQTLKLTAPAQPGNYDYLCSYPEHWQTMFGQLVVVQDRAALLEANAAPASPPARPPTASIHRHALH